MVRKECVKNLRHESVSSGHDDALLTFLQHTEQSRERIGGEVIECFYNDVGREGVVAGEDSYRPHIAALARLNAGGRVFDDDAAFRRDIQAAGCQQKGLRVGLAVFDLFAIDQRGEVVPNAEDIDNRVEIAARC
jgi:hypothetical protein